MTRSFVVALAATPLLLLTGGVLAASSATALEPSETHVLASAVAFDGRGRVPTTASRTVTLPVRVGIGPKGPVVYIVTETSDAGDAVRRGLNYSPKLSNALGTRAVQRVSKDRQGVVHFAGTVDFSPRRVVVPGPAPHPYPPLTATPGAVGDASYSPLTTSGDGVVVAMPQIANITGVNDSVVSIDLVRGQATLTLFGGFYDDHPVLYVRTEASDPALAAIESSTWAPNLNAAPGIGSDDPASSAREAIVPVVNGPTGVTNPQRQGLDSALAGEGAPLNLIQEDPADPSDDSSRTYSPVWDVTPAVWTDAAVADGTRSRLTSIDAVHSRAGSGALSSGGTGVVNEEVGLRAAGFVSFCPVIAVLAVPAS